MRVLVTGITGFVGGHLARHLVDLGHEVSGLATDPVRGPLGDLVREIHTTDVTDPEQLAAVVRQADPEAIVHLAGLSSVGRSWEVPGDYLRINFCGTRNLMHAADGRRVLFASSAEVYGNVPESEQPIRESRPLDPRSPYAMTKACAEEVALDYGALVVRSFNSIGPGQARHFALPSFAGQLADIGAVDRSEIEPVLRVGDLSPRRDFLHVADAVAGYAAILEHGEDAGVYNLASGQAHSIRQALDGLIEVSGVEADIEVDPARVRPVDVPLLQGDNGRLRALGWRPEKTFRDALEDIWREILAERSDAT